VKITDNLEQRRTSKMFRLVRELIRPYRWQLVIILLAMMVETAISLAGPLIPSSYTPSLQLIGAE
jgi:hypothetical protein